ncbi:hypothetical protein ACFQ73_28555 [Amycolatopsis japonica]|uniref:hypothetical protein n=1 Tax=Amycolatopsis japonica TaxID=208439 RepID=UPI00366EB197
MRLFVARMSMGRIPTLQVVNLALAIVGAWSIIYQLLRLLVPIRNAALGVALAGAAALVGAVVLMWFRLARRPQDFFSAAARSEERAETLRQTMQHGMVQDFAYENLTRLYTPIVRQVEEFLPAAQVNWPADAAGNRCLVITIAPPGEQRLDRLITDIEGPRGDDWKRRVSEFAPGRQAFMATLRRSASLANPFGDEAGTNIVLARITAAPDLAISVNTATYGQIVRTCDALVNEFALFASLASRSALRKKPRPLLFNGGDLLKVLPWRRQVHAWDDEDILLVAPRSRASGLGVSLALVDEQDGRPSAFVARRSSNVGTYPDVLHVVPSGMMNARATAPHTTEDLAALPHLTMMSEFLEECFDVAELAGHSVGNFAKRVEEKTNEFQVGNLEPVFTGLAIDLLNLRTEVCGVLDLARHQTVVDAFNLSWEYTHTEKLRRVALKTSRPPVRRTDFVQSGIGSIQLAAMWAEARRKASS